MDWCTKSPISYKPASVGTILLCFQFSSGRTQAVSLIHLNLGHRPKLKSASPWPACRAGTSDFYIFQHACEGMAFREAKEDMDVIGDGIDFNPRLS